MARPSDFSDPSDGRVFFYKKRPQAAKRRRWTILAKAGPQHSASTAQACCTPLRQQSDVVRLVWGGNMLRR
jgi:hypothetical protein